MQDLLGAPQRNLSEKKISPLANPVAEAKLIDWRAAKSGQQKVIACVDRSNMDSRVAAHAQELARRLQIPLVLAQVLEPANQESPQDPVTWSILRHRCRERLESLNARLCFDNSPEQVLLEGRAADELSAWATESDMPLLVLATHADDHLGRARLGSTAQRLLEIAPVSLFLIPPTAPSTPAYRRILVPLDGSCRAESVLPTVVSLARDPATEVLVVHAVPHPQISQMGPLEPDALALRDQLFRRNEQVARTYLERIVHYLGSCGIKASSILLQGDPREWVQHAAADHHADLMVIAAHGHTGRADMPCGSVAFYLVTHAATPVLIIRNDEESRAFERTPQEYCSIQFMQ
jgi:nucleotide-binding universal stress UspA family protein